jgi:hypothetical protein
MKGDKIYVQLTKDWRAFYGQDNKGTFFVKLFEASEQKKEEGIEYWALCYKNKEELQRAKDNLDPEVKHFIGIKEKIHDTWTSLSWMVIDNEWKKAFFANLYDNNTEKAYDKLMIFVEADYREKPTNVMTDTSTDKDWNFWDDTKEETKAERTAAKKPF